MPSFGTKESGWSCFGRFRRVQFLGKRVPSSCYNVSDGLLSYIMTSHESIKTNMVYVDCRT